MKIAVIGGGPAGMMAAIAAAENGANVTLFDSNEKLGKKLYITGKGRCNVTNDCSVPVFMANVVTNAKFLFGALSKFDSAKTIAFFEKNGMSVKTERGGRVFPSSDKASDVTKTMSSLMGSLGVEICLNNRVLALFGNEKGVTLHTISGIVCYDKAIIATGGVSYPTTGSTGDGYIMARKLGHSVVEPRPALTELILLDDVKSLQGLSLKNIEIGVSGASVKNSAVEFGEMLFTANGISGPAALTLSSRINKYKFSDLTLYIDLKPALDSETLSHRLLLDFEAKSNKEFRNSLDELLPGKLCAYVAERSGISLNKRVNQITAKERAELVGLLKRLTFKLKSLGPIEGAIVTSGGVDVSQINPSTMESKLARNVYFAGEVLDVDALTGGFNIQVALATGYAAGLSAALGK